MELWINTYYLIKNLLIYIAKMKRDIVDDYLYYEKISIRGENSINLAMQVAHNNRNAYLKRIKLNNKYK